MTIPDSLQTLGGGVFNGCSKLVPSNINDYFSDAVVDYLRTQRRIAFEYLITEQAAELNAELNATMIVQTTEIEALNAKNVKQA
ncbi:hypothetical protein TL16_g01273 [Triparma laevis f. inornata]|uniref:Uncharacterized protein n=2 Tax=Triparma laevis TaxID=1534972 RepID=A0A9W7L0P6_9STRA|nr:hypothetical protein TL16_g01273 [Triparma laevis f. inornata]GMI18274.1 hypothetical protein TrLO_g2770 [Triparma laevis f. longispina]